MSDKMKCATDRDVHDLLLSNRQKFTSKVLREFALDRNIIFSKETENKDLADHLSTIIHDHYDLDSLMERRESKSRRERITFESYKVAAESEHVKDVLSSLRKGMNPESNKAFSFVQVSPSSFKITYNYTDTNYSKTRFTQHQHYSADMFLDVKDDEVQLRMPASLRQTTFLDDFQTEIQRKMLKGIGRESISLNMVKNPEERSGFFLKLISSIEALNFNGVSKVKVSSKHLIPGDFSEEQDEEAPISEEEQEEEESLEMLQAIHRMILDGENIESSKQYQELTKSGYFITSISWVGTAKISPYTKYYMEAGFSDGDTCENFRYVLKGVKNLKKGAYNKTVRPPSDDDGLWFNNTIESVSRSILEGILNPQEPEGGESNE